MGFIDDIERGPDSYQIVRKKSQHSPINDIHTSSTWYYSSDLFLYLSKMYAYNF